MHFISKPFFISALLSPLNLVSLSIIIVVLWVCDSHFELRSDICCAEIKEDQKITNAFNLGFTRECNDPPAMELLARSHMKSLDQWPHTSHPLVSPSLSLPPSGSFVSARLEHFTVSPKSLSKQEHVNTAGSAHGCLPANHHFVSP